MMRGDRNSAFFNKQKPDASLQTRFKNARARGTLSLTSYNPPLTSIPMEVFDLEKCIEDGEKFWEFEPLKALDLSFNKITSIPNDVCNLIDCSSMKFRDNLIESIPDGLFEGCVSLKHLDLGTNKIASLSGRVMNLINLKDLLLSHNNLTILPEEIINCVSISTLDLECNKIRCLPQTSWNMRCLTTLNIAHNGITVLPSCLGDIITLETLHCNSNNIAQLPDFSKLVGLKYLDASQNVLEEFPRLPRENSKNKLSHLILGYNRISHLDIGALIHQKSLSELLLHNNKLQDVPMEIEYIASLKIIDVSNNDLRDLPSSLGYMQNLQHIRAEGNPIKVIRQQILLKPVNELKAHLRSRGPSLIEAAPLEDPRLNQKVSSSVRDLDDAPVPPFGAASWQKGGAGVAAKLAPNTATVAAASAQLADRVQFRIRDINGSALDLSALSLHALPEDFVDNVMSVPLGPALLSISMARNGFEALPLELNDVPSVRSLNIGENKLRKTPNPAVTVCDIPALTSIDVSRNELDTESFQALLCPRAPPHLCNLTEIIGNNNPLRSVPSGISFQRGLKVLRLAYCQLTSVEDVDFSLLPGLVTLDLSNNKINALGDSLFSAVYLEYLSVENNNLREIPPELAALPKLKVLLISGNAQRNVRTTLLQQGSSKVIEYLRSRLPLDYVVPLSATALVPSTRDVETCRSGPPSHSSRDQQHHPTRGQAPQRAPPTIPTHIQQNYSSVKEEMDYATKSSSFRGYEPTAQLSARESSRSVVSNPAPSSRMTAPSSQRFERRTPPMGNDSWDRQPPGRTPAQGRDGWDFGPKDEWDAPPEPVRVAASRVGPPAPSAAAYSMPPSRFGRGAAPAGGGGSMGSLLNPTADSGLNNGRSGVRRTNF